MQAHRLALQLLLLPLALSSSPAGSASGSAWPMAARWGGGVLASQTLKGQLGLVSLPLLQAATYKGAGGDTSSQSQGGAVLQGGGTQQEGGTAQQQALGLGLPQWQPAGRVLILSPAGAASASGAMGGAQLRVGASGTATPVPPTGGAQQGAGVSGMTTPVPSMGGALQGLEAGGPALVEEGAVRAAAAALGWQCTQAGPILLELVEAVQKQVSGCSAAPLPWTSGCATMNVVRCHTSECDQCDLLYL